jgi:hypothetical protein
MIILAAGQFNPTVLGELSISPWLVVVCSSPVRNGAKRGLQVIPLLGRGRRHKEQQRCECEDAHVEVEAAACELTDRRRRE